MVTSNWELTQASDEVHQGLSSLICDYCSKYVKFRIVLWIIESDAHGDSLGTNSELNSLKDRRFSSTDSERGNKSNTSRKTSSMAS